MAALNDKAWVQMSSMLASMRTTWKRFLRASRGNVAMIFGLSLIPITAAAGVGVDMARALVVRTEMASALDSAALAIGASTGISQSAAQTLAQQYFNANYKVDPTYGTPGSPTVTISGQSVTIAASDTMPTTILNAVGISNLTISVSSKVVWGQTKLWVSLVLDNTGSMTQTDKTGTSKISALKTATNQLLTILSSASSNPGDVQVALIPFSKDVNVGTSNVSASWIDWTDWSAAPANGTPSSSVGPGSTCPYTSSSKGFTCQKTSTNDSSSITTIASSGSNKGLICPSVDDGSKNSGRMGRYYNGCYTSVQNGSSWTHTWVPNSTSTWDGCVMDRTQNNDVSVTTPSGTSTDFPAENAQSCVPSVMLGTLGYNWTNLTNAVNAMTAGGATNQPIGLAWGWQALTGGSPLSAPALPANTSEYIIILSDGLNTQDRWTGDGSDEDSGTDARMNTVCANAKAAGVIIYAVFVDLNGTQGNSTVLQNCATDSSKYYDLTTSGAIVTTFQQIGQQITNLHVAQ
jgi:Flp pilus assembly protein TadG